VTVTASLAACTNTAPPAPGSRSAKKRAIRGGPWRKRVTLRGVAAVSALPNVRLPSELTKRLR
jgi:hypothetical protein